MRQIDINAKRIVPVLASRSPPEAFRLFEVQDLGEYICQKAMNVGAKMHAIVSR
jgi:hypothetical protein